MLDFEREWWTMGGTKEAAIRARFAMSASHYYRILGRILDDPEALLYDPLTVKRLLRLRGHRRRLRYEGRRAGPGPR